jgi:serine protease Do
MASAPMEAHPSGSRRARGAAAALLGLVCLAPPAGAEDPFLRRTVAVQVVEKTAPAVVSITTEHVVQSRPFQPFTADPFFERFFSDFFEPSLPQAVQNLGSGVVIDADGHVLTNEHVVAHASRIRVGLADGREFDAELIGADPNNYVAVLRLSSRDAVPWIPMAKSSDLMVGEPVIAIGNPFGLSHTVTTGVVSALNRSIRTENHVYHGFLQTDASINPGNSGGPLLNANGDLVAINTAVYQGGQGIGFAIPIETAARVVRELIEEGEVSPVWLGLEFQELTPEVAQALALPDGTRGALVNQVDTDSPAGRAQLRRGDVVTRLDDRKVASARDFFDMLDSAVEGQEIALRFLREGRERRVSVRAEEVPGRVVDALVRERLGVELEPNPGGGYAVRAVRPGTGAARIGLQPGDLLLGINGRALEDADALRRCALDLRGRDRALIVVQRGGGRYHVAIPLV